MEIIELVLSILSSLFAILGVILEFANKKSGRICNSNPTIVINNTINHTNVNEIPIKKNNIIHFILLAVLFILISISVYIYKWLFIIDIVFPIAILILLTLALHSSSDMFLKEKILIAINLVITPIIYICISNIEAIQIYKQAFLNLSFKTPKEILSEIIFSHNSQYEPSVPLVFTLNVAFHWISYLIIFLNQILLVLCMKFKNNKFLFELQNKFRITLYYPIGLFALLLFFIIPLLYC